MYEPRFKLILLLTCQFILQEQNYNISINKVVGFALPVAV